jgi:Zn-dependent protease with chaperone function
MATLLAILLGIPLLALLTSVGIQWKLNSELRESLLKQYPERASQIQGITVSQLCELPDTRNEEADACSFNDHMNLMKTGAIIGAGLSIALIVLIKLAGLLARRQRILLVRLFGPGIHLTLLILSALMILYAALGIAVIYYGESTLIGRIHIGIMLGLGLGALFGVYALLHAQFHLLKSVTARELGQKLEPAQHEKIWKFVHDLAASMKAEVPDAIIAGLAPNFYVTEASVICLDGKMTGRTMYVSLPLCRILSVDELKAVLAHELAHYKGLDTQYSQKFYPIYRGSSQAMANIASGFSEKGGAGQLVLLPAFTTIGYFLDCFSKAEREISRERELAADSEAAKVTSPSSFGSALVKICGFSPIWPAIKVAIKDALGKGKSFTNVSALFAGAVVDLNPAEVRNELSEEGPPHPTDTHPRLSDRLSNLGLTIDDVFEPALKTSPDVPACSLFESANELEESLTQAEHAFMIQTGEATLGTAPNEA